MGKLMHKLTTIPGYVEEPNIFQVLFKAVLSSQQNLIESRDFPYILCPHTCTVSIMVIPDHSGTSVNSRRTSIDTSLSSEVLSLH